MVNINWLGTLIQKEIDKEDTVLDLGCGIMQATTSIFDSPKKIRLSFNSGRPIRGNIQCKSLLGCDIWPKYLDIAKKHFPVVRLGMNELDRFVNDSYDIVISLDVLEHLDLSVALDVIEHMKRIARKKVIIYTPSQFKTNEENESDSWGMGYNPNQRHRCFIEPTKFSELGFNTTFPEPDRNTLAIFTKKTIVAESMSSLQS